MIGPNRRERMTGQPASLGHRCLLGRTTRHSVAAINKYTTSPDFTARYKKWRKSLGPETLAAWR